MVKKYCNQSTIKMEPNDIESNTYIDSSEEINDKSPKFKIVDIARISRYKFFFYKKLCSKLVQRSYL